MERIVLASDNPFFDGFQYVDWQFDGEDLVSVIRLAMEGRAACRIGSTMPISWYSNESSVSASRELPIRSVRSTNLLRGSQFRNKP